MYFTFNYISSADFGLRIKSVDYLHSTSRKYEKVDIRGRESLTIDTGGFNDGSIEVVCIIESDDLIKTSREIKAWLIGDVGYKPLTFSTEPDVEYPAICTNKIDFTEVIPNLGEVIITFDCKLGNLKSGSELMTLTYDQVITNLGTIESCPYIKIYGSGEVDFYIDDAKIKVFIDDYIEIDSELVNCYKGALNRNNKMIGEFPIIPIGESTIRWSGNVSKVELLPRWRVI